MPNISWNEIRNRALLFSREWSEATREQSDKQTFWNEFFNVFGLTRRHVASFEEPVKRITGSTGFIDLFWPGKLLVEHKTYKPSEQNLEPAQSQAFAYIRDLIDSGRQDEAPRYILLSDFRRFALYDLEPDEQRELPLFFGLRFKRTEFGLDQLKDHVLTFAFIPGYQVHRHAEQDPANLKAVALMAALHDTLKAGGYSGHDLERLLVRTLFCLFAEDSGIFEPSAFELYIENRTQRDGSDLGARLNHLFRILDTPVERRQSNLDEALASMPYVNGQLFAERLEFADFNIDQRNALLSCSRFDWSRISPAIFGALFQEVLTPSERRHIGAHYTSERDILKVIKPLFLDALRSEFASIKMDRSKRRKARLDELRLRLSKLRFLDPACGCGNFLVIAYRELRALELDILREQHRNQAVFTFDEVTRMSTLDVDQFYGIEIEEWPVRIAEVALWLMDHQSNVRIHEAFGQPYLRLPLRNSPHIHHGNALRMDWNELLPVAECSHVLGNPPFVGHHLQSREQKADQHLVLKDISGNGVLDHVSNWFIKAATFIRDTPCSVGFVATNSITQGEQVGLLWNEMFSRYGVKIIFAYQTFTWESEARGRAHVHVVVAGFAVNETGPKRIYSVSPDGKDVTFSDVQNISPYLVSGPDRALKNRSTAISDVPPMVWGSKPSDGGHLLLSEEEKLAFVTHDPRTRKWLRPYVGASEFLNGERRWCLWLKGITAAELNDLTEIKSRVAKVRQMRLNSKAEATRRRAATATLFAQDAQPDSPYLLIPLHSSEHRNYLTVGFLDPNTVASNACGMIPNAKLFDLGVLSSAMHMAWIRQVCGRLESRYRYSRDIVYNNFPWPLHPSNVQRTRVEELAQVILDVRAQFIDSTLAALYDPLLMPPALLRAHQRLDRAVELCYRTEPFANDRARVEYLFALYEQLVAPLLPTSPRRSRRAKTT